MTGRGIDQILPHPGDPRIHEPALRSALDYVALAEAANGPLPKPVDFSYVWGDVLAELDRRRPDVRVVNLETSITARGEPAPKAIQYRMNPGNLPVLSAAGLRCCTLANNHVLDWGVSGLVDTLEALRRGGIETAGAGRNLREAAAPAIVPLAGKGRVLVFAFGTTSSGIPRTWGATPVAPGVNLVPEHAPHAVPAIAEQVRAARRAGDLAVASVHWGPNWGYDIPDAQIAFTHGLVEDAGFDVVFCHSSHHPKAIEVHHGKPILYGCGDFLDDYEGIGGYETFRDDLVLAYFTASRLDDGMLADLTLVPFQIRGFRLHRAHRVDVEWVLETLNRENRRFATRLHRNADDSLSLTWERAAGRGQ